MPRSNLLKDALSDLGEDIAFHAGSLVHRAFDGLVLLALGLLVYVSTIDTASAGLHGRVMFGVRAEVSGTVGIIVNASQAPSSCHLTNDLLPSEHRSCTQAMILEPAVL